MQFVHLVVKDTPGERADVTHAFTTPEEAIKKAQELFARSPKDSFLAVSVKLEHGGDRKFSYKPAGL